MNIPSDTVEGRRTRLAASFVTPSLRRLFAEQSDAEPGMRLHWKQAALLWIDIVSFTALSNRLIKQGPRGVETLPIEGDLVRLWRDGLGRRIADAPERVAAIVGHDTALLLAGLARESRLRTSQTRLDRGIVRLEFRKRP